MRRIVCIKCGCEFEPDEPFYVLCGPGENNCSGEVDLYGSGTVFRAASVLVNAHLNVEEEELLRESPPLLKLMTRLLSGKRPPEFKNFLEQLMKEVR